MTESGDEGEVVVHDTEVSEMFLFRNNSLYALLIHDHVCSYINSFLCENILC